MSKEVTSSELAREFNMDFTKALAEHYQEKYPKEGLENAVYAYELTTCQRKIEYRDRFSDAAMLDRQRWPLLKGEAVDDLINNILEEDYITDGSMDFKIPETEGIKFIRCRPDVLALREPGNIPIEIKTTKSLRYGASKHHAIQANVYAQCWDAPFALLFYFSPDGRKYYRIGRDMDVNIPQLIREMDASPRWDWECSYCPFSHLCPFKKVEKKK